MIQLHNIRKLVQDSDKRYGPEHPLTESWAACEHSLTNPHEALENTLMRNVLKNSSRGVNALLIGAIAILCAICAGLFLNSCSTLNAAAVEPQKPTLSYHHDLEIEAIIIGEDGAELTGRSISAAVTDGAPSEASYVMGERAMYLSQLEIEPTPFYAATNGAGFSLMLKPWDTRSTRGDRVTVLCRGYYGGEEIPVQQTEDDQGFTLCTVNRP